jgi:hypothetical protein
MLEMFCDFKEIDSNEYATYTCHQNIFNLENPASACHFGDRVVQAQLDLQSNKKTLLLWNNLVSYFRSESPTEIFNLDNKYIGKDYHDLGCTLHTCDSFKVDASVAFGNQSASFSTPDQYFFLAPLEWDPAFYPNDTMFEIEFGNSSYPNVSFCRSLYRQKRDYWAE